MSNVVKYEEVRDLGNNKDVLIVDVREPSELKSTGIIPGSINIPVGQLENVLSKMPVDEFFAKYGREKPSKTFPLIFSCKMGGRSTKAVEISQHMGYTNVRNYTGGWMDWEKHLKATN